MKAKGLLTVLLSVFVSLTAFGAQESGLDQSKDYFSLNIHF